eukprot:9161923-Pyramimonas_sp.AAC.1
MRGPRRPKKNRPDGLEWRHSDMTPEGCEMSRGACGQPQIASRRPKRIRCSLPRGPQEAKTVDLNVFQCLGGFSTFELATLHDVPRGLQDRPKAAQEIPNTAPRLAKR